MKKHMKQTFIIRTIDDFKKKAHDYTLEDIEDAIQADRQALRKGLDKIKPPEEDDTETTLYRHCEEGDHWKCSGYGENGTCVCKCHAIDTIYALLKGEE